ncbi:hypothetical protein SAMN04490357_1025 [Streptomyces misionensis]|uniref:Uncharacterized protein n=1 Tax=Streptomyces misionensis TaxID=67331 RepID=A0A1H4P9B0_9ACTN|nr:hypothetical protein [Streptomyces misionensis]SEC03915.1 hypothetical protein SAMN04490357_1025 [Streptomyces misionensis]
MSARADLLREMTHNHLYMDDDRANELIDAYAHELAEQIRQMDTDPGTQFAADHIDPHVRGAAPVHPDEEPTT